MVSIRENYKLSQNHKLHIRGAVWCRVVQNTLKARAGECFFGSKPVVGTRISDLSCTPPGIDPRGTY